MHFYVISEFEFFVIVNTGFLLTDFFLQNQLFLWSEFGNQANIFTAAIFSHTDISLVIPP